MANGTPPGNGPPGGKPPGMPPPLPPMNRPPAQPPAAQPPAYPAQGQPQQGRPQYAQQPGQPQQPFQPLQRPQQSTLGNYPGGYPAQQQASRGYYPPQQPQGQPRTAPPGMQPPQQRAAPPAMRADQRPGAPRPANRAPSRRSFGIGKAIVLGLVALMAIAGAGAAYFVANAPADLVRDRIVAEVKAKTGRDLKITGPATFTLYPNIGVQMRGVSLSPPPGMTGRPLITMDSLDVSVRILPLLKREVYVERIILQKPVFELYADKQGRKSWEFANAFAARPVQLAQAAPPAPAPAVPVATDAPSLPAQAPAGGAASIQQLHFGNVRIDDGTVRYADAATGAQQEASAINMKVAMADMRQPLDAKGDLVWRGQKIDLDVNLTSVKALMDDKPGRLALTMAAPPANARFDGSLSLREGYELQGSLNGKSDSVRALAKWLGTELPRVRGYGPLEASGQLRATPKQVSLSGANIVLDGATATGQVTVETPGERPYVRTTLNVSELDLNKYLGGTSSAPGKAAAPPAAAPGSAQSIEDLLQQDGPSKPDAKGTPKVKAYSKRAGWSTEPIDLAGLGAVDADAKLSVGRLLYQDIKVGQSQLTVALKNKVMKTNFEDIQLYGGRGRGFITLDGTSGKSANAGANLSFDGIDAQPFLRDAADIDKLSGKAKLLLAVAGQGANQQQLMNALNGKADFTFANGAINGLNVAGMIRGISQGQLTGLKTSPSEKTDFSELASSWTISNGVATNQDLRLISPLLRLTGGGNVMLGTQQADYIMRPKLVSSLAGQGGAADEQGLEVPVRVHGPWSDLEYTPDLKGILADPNKTMDTVKQIGKQFEGKNAKEALKSLLGGGKQEPATTGSTGAQQAQPKPNAKQLLDQFLKPQ